MQLPADYQTFLNLSPEQIQQLCDELAERPLNPSSIDRWLQDWTNLAVLFQECLARLDVATSVNTADETARQRLAEYRQTIWPIGSRMDQMVEERLETHAALLPPVLREVRARRTAATRLNQAQAAVDLLNQEAELVMQYEAITGAQTVQWEGETIPERWLYRFLDDADRSRRERAWRTMHENIRKERDAIHRIWAALIDTRIKLAEVNGFADYLSYRWTELERTDYTPEDSARLHSALYKHWSPLYESLMAQQKKQLQIETVRPWDRETGEPLRPFTTADDLFQKTLRIFQRLDPEFGAYVIYLRDQGMIDLAERTHTATMGGFSRAIGRHGNFIFLNVHSTRFDAENLIHEIGHAVSLKAACQQPYADLFGFPADFSETPSGAMEMLTQPYWDEFYHPDDLQVAYRQYFRAVLRLSLQQAGFDAFQHRVYRNPQQAQKPDTCDAWWHECMSQYLPGIDWTGLEELHGMFWQRRGTHFYLPLHGMEYVYGHIAGLHLLTLPQSEAITRYKAAIAPGNSVPPRELFAILGMDFPITGEAVAAAALNLAQRI